MRWAFELLLTDLIRATKAACRRRRRARLPYQDDVIGPGRPGTTACRQEHQNKLSPGWSSAWHFCRSPPPVAGPVSAKAQTPARSCRLTNSSLEYREVVAEVIRDNHFHQQSKPDTFPCNPRIYLGLLNDPMFDSLPVAGPQPDAAPRLETVAPGVYQGTDGNGAAASWEFAYRSPRLHVLYCKLNYNSPRGSTRIEGRVVLVVRSGFYREIDGETWVQHDIEAFVKVDSRGWRAIAATARPIIERLLEDQMKEAGWFVSLMARMVEMYPSWAIAVAVNQPLLPPESRDAFRDLVHPDQTPRRSRRPPSTGGRPTASATARRAGLDHQAITGVPGPSGSGVLKAAPLSPVPPPSPVAAPHDCECPAFGWCSTENRIPIRLARFANWSSNS